MTNDEEHLVAMDIPINERDTQYPLPMQGSYVDDDDMGFYKYKTFKDKHELISLLKLASVKKYQRFKPVKNSKDVYCVRCVDPADVIGPYIHQRFLNGKGPSTKEIRNITQDEIGCKISYWKSWKASEIAKAIIRGTPAHSYTVLDAYNYMLRTVNEGSKTSLKIDDKERFKYFFVSYRSWIRGFVHMRKVLAVDRTFLRGLYEEVLLSVVAQDTKNHIFHVSFCVVDKECDASYEYFFEKLLDIVPNTTELCIIFYRHPSIRKMVSKIYSEAHHGCCTRHLAENARNEFHCMDFLGHFYHATKAYRRDVFNDHFEEIRYINAEIADYLENVGFHKWSRAYFPGNRSTIIIAVVGTTATVVPTTAAVVGQLETVVPATDCWKPAVVCIQILKNFGFYISEREFPITALFDAISRRWSEIFHEWRMSYVNLTTIFVPSAENKIMTNKNLGNKLLVHRIDEDMFTITWESGVSMVDPRRKTCSCRESDLDKIPYSHAMAALRSKFGDEYGNMIYEYSSSYYKVESYVLAYVDPIFPVPAEEFWNAPPEILPRRVPPPEKKTKWGRKQMKRVPGVAAEISKKNFKNCSLCRRFGHKKTTCPTKRDGDVGTSRGIGS
ncbi:uncharacterized protein LOC132620094 [Lycium barbarum]|uniref:uncharacterized protein LOC132620094 n=1 Tax=Lycium barbarum TaxID=112863 RepID=UPI00293E65E2|nr:uncharacterized protein LOC132620094 [Lycium barbarum]